MDDGDDEGGGIQLTPFSSFLLHEPLPERELRQDPPPFLPIPSLLLDTRSSPYSDPSITRGRGATACRTRSPHT